MTLSTYRAVAAPVFLVTCSFNQTGNKRSNYDRRPKRHQTSDEEKLLGPDWGYSSGNASRTTA